MVSNPPTRFTQLEQWFSGPRMSTYGSFADPEAIYIWNTRLSKAYLEDIQHIEVLLRNRIDTQLSAARGSHWFDDDSYFRFTGQFKKAVATAKRRAGSRYSPGKVIAELTFDTWRFLLARRYKTTLWPIVFRGLPNLAAEGRGQEDFEGQVAVIYGLRNRCAHHEPLVKRDPLAEAARLDTFDAALSQVARWIDSDAALWIDKNSRIPAIRNSRPNYPT